MVTFLGNELCDGLAASLAKILLAQWYSKGNLAAKISGAQELRMPSEEG